MSRRCRRAGDAVGGRHGCRRVRRLHRQGAERRSERSRGLEAPAGHQLDPVRELYGGFVPGAMLPHSVYGYFNNGGSLAYIVRIPHTDAGRPSRACVRCRRRPRPRPGASRSPPSSPTPTSGRRHRPRHRADDADDDAPPTFRVDVIEGGKIVETLRGPHARPASPRRRSTPASTKVKVATKIDIEQARRRPRRRVPAGIVRDRAARRPRRSPSPAARSPVPRPPAPASTASSSPTTSRW